MKNNIRIIFISGLLSASTIASAGDDAAKTQPLTSAQYFVNHLSGTFDLTNNYTFRGISQTQKEAALQGGLTYTFDSKVYLNVWGSNVNFPSPTGQTATLETDEVIGYGDTINDWNYDLHLVRYTYPRASTASYGEAIGSIGYKFLTFLMGYSPDVFGSHGPGTYSNLGVSFDIPAKYVYFDGVNVSGGIGNYNLNSNAGNSYQDYNVLITKAISDKYSVSLQWVDTNHKNPPYDGNQWVATIAAKF